MRRLYLKDFFLLGLLTLGMTGGCALSQDLENLEIKHNKQIQDISGELGEERRARRILNDKFYQQSLLVNDLRGEIGGCREQLYELRQESARNRKALENILPKDYQGGKLSLEDFHGGKVIEEVPDSEEVPNSEEVPDSNY